MTPIPPLFRADDPLVWIVHFSISSDALSLFGTMNLAIKSTSACALIVVLAKFDCLLNHLFCSLGLVHGFLYGLAHHH